MSEDRDELLRWLMHSAIEETDGGNREPVIREFLRMIEDGPDDGENAALLDALGDAEGERYESACELFRICKDSGATAKRARPQLRLVK